jgi:hypothetical protein
MISNRAFGIRFRRHRRGDHHLADFADEGVSRVGPGLDAHPEVGCLHLAGVYRQQRVAADERRAHVGATAVGAEQHVPLDRVVDPVPHGVGQG